MGARRRPTARARPRVVGATGRVGSFFVQVAAGTGATVIAPALPELDGRRRKRVLAKAIGD